MNRGSKSKLKALQSGQQVTIDIKDAVLKTCECGCRYFQPVTELYILSSVMSPTGKELPIQKPVLMCLECKAVMEIGGVS